MKPWSIERLRDIFPIILISVLPVFIFGLVTINQGLKVVREAAEKEDKIVTSNLANQVEFYIIRARDIIQSIAEFPPEKIDRDVLKSIYFNNSFKGFPLFESLILLNESGKVEIIYPERKEFLGFDYSRYPSFIYVKEKEKIFFSEIGFSSITEQPVITIAAPVFKRGPERILAGVIQASIRLQALSLLVKEFSLQREKGQAFLIDRFGEIIAHPDYRLVIERENIANIDPPLATELKKILKPEGTFQYLSSEKIKYLATFQTISPTNWKLVTRQELREILSTPLRLRFFLLSVLTLTLIGAGGISYNIASFLARIRKEQEKIREERLREAEESKAILEIKVKARTKELEELAQALEAKVKERTKELHKKIEELESFKRVAVGRELKMIELKKEIERLKKELENTKIEQRRLP
jgi:hypothetical protein